MGNFGTYLRSRLCIDLYTRKGRRYERMDILGTMEPEKLPGWAKHGLLTVQQERAKKNSTKAKRRHDERWMFVSIKDMSSRIPVM